MKRMFIASGIVLWMFATSCEKKGNFDCTCGIVGSSTNSYTTTIENATKSNASDLCYKYGGQYMPSGSFGCSVTATP